MFAPNHGTWSLVLETFQRRSAGRSLQHAADIWLFDASDFRDSLSEAMQLLTEDESASLLRLGSDRLKERFMVRRSVLRALLALYVGVDPSAIEYQFGEFGKPKIQESLGTKIDFSLSHSENKIAIAVSDTWIGVDIEQLEPFPELAEVVDRCFTNTERTAFFHESNKDPWDRFFRTWTCKEAVAKSCGLGLRLDLKQIETPQEALGTDSWMSIAVPGDAMAQCMVRSCRPCPSFVMAVAISPETRNTTMLLLEKGTVLVQ
jgi:4'-phosphopantetheinyl transferase